MLQGTFQFVPPFGNDGDGDDDDDGGGSEDDDANMGHLLPFFGANFNNFREKESFQLHCFAYKLIQRNFKFPKVD